MKTYLLICLTLISIASLEAVITRNGTKLRKVVRKVRKNSTKVEKLTKNKEEETKSESYHIPVVIAPLEKLSQSGHSLPVSIEYTNGPSHSAGGPYLNAKIVRVIAPHDAPAYISPHDTPVHISPHDASVHITPQDAQVHVPNYEPPAEPQHDYDFQNDHISDGSDYENQRGYHEDYDNGAGWRPEAQSHEQQVHAVYQEHSQDDDGQYHGYGEDYGGDLSSIPGVPGVDYPIYSSLPETHFKCLQHSSTPGFYADVDTKCQVWHYCQPDGRHDRFLCPNGTVFDQLTRVCNWWYNVQCDDSLAMYDINFDLYRDPPADAIKVQTLQVYDMPRTSLPSQNLVVIPPASSQLQTTKNSFLEHVKSFEDRHHRVGDYLPGPNEISEPATDDNNNYTPLQSAANPYIDKYPQKMAPTPVVVVTDSSTDNDGHDRQNNVQHHQPRSAALVLQRHIEYSPQTVNDNTEPQYLAPINGPHGLYDEDSRFPRDWQHFKVVLKPVSDEADENIPTYRERKATPFLENTLPANKKKFRVVKRRKLYKDQ